MAVPHIKSVAARPPASQPSASTPEELPQPQTVGEQAPSTLIQEDYWAFITKLLSAGEYESAATLAADAATATPDNEALLAQVANTWASNQPDAAARWASAQSAQLRGLALAAVNDTWLHSDPNAAAEFINALPEDSQRSALMQEAMSRWLAIDQSSAIHWLAVAGTRQEFDTPLFNFVTADELIRNDTPAALYWAQRITDSSLRMTAIEQIHARFKSNNVNDAASDT